MSPGYCSPARFGNGVTEGPAVESRWLGGHGCHSEQPSGYKLQGPTNEACSVSFYEKCRVPDLEAFLLLQFNLS